MPFQITCTEHQRGSFLKLTFHVKNIYDSDRKPYGEIVTKPFCIGNLAQVRFHFIQILPSNYSSSNRTANPVSIKISSKGMTPPFTSVDNHSHIDLDVYCEELKYSEQLLCMDQWIDWIEMGKRDGKCEGTYYKVEPLEITMVVYKKEIVTFSKLYEDEDLTDFKLSTTEGSVSVHKVCLAAHSDMFRAMLSNDWKETANGCVKIQGVTLQTLQHLKDYIYLNVLPEKDGALRSLLILASYYLMDVLTSECVRKLSRLVTSENLQSLLEYACANNLPELIFAILEQTPSEVVHYACLNKRSKSISAKNLPNLLQSLDLKKKEEPKVLNEN